MTPLWSRRPPSWVTLPDLGELCRSLKQIGRSVDQIARPFAELGRSMEQISHTVRAPGEQLQRLSDDRDTANAQLGRLRALPAGRRRKVERLAAYCPRGCQVVAVYATSGALLLELRGDVLITGKTPLVNLPDGRSRFPTRCAAFSGREYVTTRVIDTPPGPRLSN